MINIKNKQYFCTKRIKMDNNKKVLIGLSVLAIAGVGFYFWKKNKDKDDALKSIQQKLNVNPNNQPVATVQPVAPVQTTANTEIKSSFDGDFSAYKCSCTGKKIDRNSDAEVFDKFKKSCVKNGGIIMEIK